MSIVRGLQNRIAIVTDAAQGIGKGIARRMLEEGASVLIADILPDGVENAVADLAVVGSVAGSVTDVGKRASVQEMLETSIRELGRVDILVNNAGIAHTAPFLEITDQDWDRILDTNLRGTFLCSQIVGRQMVAQGNGGAIVNIASTNGLRGQPMLADYGASKAGIINLTQTAALELGANKIRVNAVCPGTIWTEMSEAAGWTEATWDAIRSHTAMNTFGYPADIAAAVAYLSSDDARFVTGSVLVVDGGLTARQLNLPGSAVLHRHPGGSSQDL